MKLEILEGRKKIERGCLFSFVNTRKNRFPSFKNKKIFLFFSPSACASGLEISKNQIGATVVIIRWIMTFWPGSRYDQTMHKRSLSFVFSFLPPTSYPCLHLCAARLQLLFINKYYTYRSHDGFCLSLCIYSNCQCRLTSSVSKQWFDSKSLKNVREKETTERQRKSKNKIFPNSRDGPFDKRASFIQDGC